MYIEGKSLMFGQSLFVPGERCPGGYIRRQNVADTCKAQIEAEKNISAKVIKYNLFADLVK
ncbi:MAG: hypothetical protein HGB11_16115 [Chlorobiales bacterium]|nr:hypothetical protein [Chlorobiales bacterium]